MLLGMASLGSACQPAREPAQPEPPSPPLVIGVSPAAPTPAPEPVAPDEAVPKPSLAVPSRDPRVKRSVQRAKSVLVAEVQSLEAIHNTTALGSPDRWLVARRLAEAHADLGRATEGSPEARSAHRSSARYYMVSMEDPKAGQRDEASYYAALELELLGEGRGARQQYYELIKMFPSSPMIPFAYFAFGEMFFIDAETDPSKYQLAEQAYREVLKYPPAQNVLYVEAHRRLAEINLRLGAGPIKRP